MIPSAVLVRWSSSMELDLRTKTAEGIINAAMWADPDRKIYLAWDEYNVWYRARGPSQRGEQVVQPTGRHRLEQARGRRVDGFDGTVERRLHQAERRPIEELQQQLVRGRVHGFDRFALHVEGLTVQSDCRKE